jgi:hypothetical protein
MHRAQILLYPEQHRALSEVAREEDRSISDVVRDILQQYLEERSLAARLLRERQALYDLEQIRERIEGRYGVYQGDLVAEARAEREAQMNASQSGGD